MGTIRPRAVPGICSSIVTTPLQFHPCLVLKGDAHYLAHYLVPMASKLLRFISLSLAQEENLGSRLYTISIFRK